MNLEEYGSHDNGVGGGNAIHKRFGKVKFNIRADGAGWMELQETV